jgi:hypothetical protein
MRAAGGEKAILVRDTWIALDGEESHRSAD